MKKRSNLIFLILAALLTLPALWGILHPGFFLSDDGNWMVIRFSAFYETLRNGQFPVRFLSRLNNGYGYPVADFLYPLFMYIGVPIHVLGFSFVSTIKIIFAASLILSSVFSFLYLRRLFDNLSSLVGSLAYTFFPYHLWDLYKRGSVGEVLALGIVPFTLWAIEMGNLPLIGLGYGLLIVSHNSLALLFLPVLFGYQLLSTSKNQVVKSLNAIGIGLLLSFFFWLPALYDKQFTVFDKTRVSDFANYFVSDYNLFGFITLVALIGSLSLLRRGEKKLIFFFTVTTLACFLSLSLSKVIWQSVPIVGFIQFPFRILSIVILGSSYLIAYQLSKLGSKFKTAFAAAYLILIFISSGPFMFPKNYQYYPDSFYSTNQDSTTVKNEYMPKWATNVPVKGADSKAEVINGHEKLNVLTVNPNGISIQAYFPMQRTLQINTIYFPGWEVRVDGKIVPIDYNSNGLIRFNVPSGSHSIVSRFGETQARLIADAISLIGLTLIVILFIRKYKKK